MVSPPTTGSSSEALRRSQDRFTNSPVRTPHSPGLRCQTAFDELKLKLVTTPVLAYPAFNKEFVLETDASIQGLGAVLFQVQSDEKLHTVAFASRALSPQERNYSITELETLAAVWAISHFHHCVYGNCLTVYTDHTAVRAVLEAPNPTGKHARWWMRVYGGGIRDIKIKYRAGKENLNADALSQSPHAPAPTHEEVQVAAMNSADSARCFSTADEQRKDPKVKLLVDYFSEDILSEDPPSARKTAAQGPLFALLDGILYYIEHKKGSRVVPQHLRKKILEETHSGPFGGHFAGY